MNEDALKHAFWRWADAALPAAVTVTKDRQPERKKPGAPVPDRPFCGIRLGVSQGRGEDERRMNGEGKMEFEGLRRMTVQFRIFGSENHSPRDLLEDLRRATQKPTTKQMLNEAGLFYVDEAGTVDNTATRGGGWEHRAQIDLRFRWSEHYTDSPEWIEKFSFDGEVDDSEGDSPKQVDQSFDTTTM